MQGGLFVLTVFFLCSDVPSTQGTREDQKQSYGALYGLVVDGARENTFVRSKTSKARQGGQAGRRQGAGSEAAGACRSLGAHLVFVVAVSQYFCTNSCFFCVLLFLFRGQACQGRTLKAKPDKSHRSFLHTLTFMSRLRDTRC